MDTSGLIGSSDWWIGCYEYLPQNNFQLAVIREGKNRMDTDGVELPSAKKIREWNRRCAD